MRAVRETLLLLLRALPARCRFNIVGLSDDQVERFTAAVVDALDA